MINGLFETHLFVSNVERSIAFYKALGLKRCHFEKERKAAFFWIGKPKQAMLGLWEKPESEIDIRHFAFQTEPDWVVKKSVLYLESKNIKPFNFFKDGTTEPMVFAWMPAVAIYFNDPDNHLLEYIGLLNETPKPELGVITWNDWIKGK